MERNFKQNCRSDLKKAGQDARVVFRRTAALFFCAVLLCALLGSCSQKPQRFSDTYYDAFDTPISVIAYCKDEEEFRKLSLEIHEEYIRYHQIFDIYNSYEGWNNAFSVNQRAGSKTMVEVPEELLDILEFSKKMYAATDGRINVAMGAVLKLWHDARENAIDHPESAAVPDAKSLKEAAKHCNINNITIDRRTSSVMLSDALMSIDLGAVGKGWATEQIAKKLEAEGHTGIALSAGGNVRVIGSREDGSAWNIAIQDPSDGAGAQDYIDTVQIRDMSLVTSGVNQRYFEAQGRRWHHIIDPDTLMPEDRFLSVTIMTKDSGLADALSTALFNMSLEDGRAFLEKINSGEIKIQGFERPSVSAEWVLSDKTLVK